MIGGKHCGIDRKNRIISVLCFFCGPWKFYVECNTENIKSQWPHILFLINFYNKKLIKLHYFPEFFQTHFHWVGDAIQPSHPLSSPSPPAFILSQHQGLFHESVLHIKWPKYWSFRFSISPSNEHSGLIFFRMDWFDLIVVQGTLKSLLQHHSSKA